MLRSAAQNVAASVTNSPVLATSSASQCNPVAGKRKISSVDFDCINFVNTNNAEIDRVEDHNRNIRTRLSHQHQSSSDYHNPEASAINFLTAGNNNSQYQPLQCLNMVDTTTTGNVSFCSSNSSTPMLIRNSIRTANTNVISPTFGDKYSNITLSQSNICSNGSISQQTFDNGQPKLTSEGFTMNKNSRSFSCPDLQSIASHTEIQAKDIHDSLRWQLPQNASNHVQAYPYVPHQSQNFENLYQYQQECFRQNQNQYQQ